MNELVGVGPTTAELFVDGRVHVHADLSPDTGYEFNGVALRTLADIGAVRARVATVNDVHFGEIECGKIEGVAEAAFFVEPGERPYPETMNESVIADITAADPVAVIVKGDLTSFGTLDEYAVFRQFYEPAFGAKLTVVRGNHDSYPGVRFADWPVQVVDVPGLRVVLLDTARDHATGGSVSAEQLAAVTELARAFTETVIVMGHHPLYVPGADNRRHFDGINEADSAALASTMAPFENVVAYTAGHTHRCRARDLDGFVAVEVACVKDFPGAWAEYLVGTAGVAQVVHRATAPEAIAWAEKTRTMFDGYYQTYAMGELADRCFTLPLTRAVAVAPRGASGVAG